MVLSLNNLNFSFSSGKQLFNSFSVTFQGPGICFLTGRNGVGKSTLARIMAGLQERNEKISGTITFNDISYDLSEQVTRNFLYKEVLFINQKTDEMIAPHFTVQENINASAVSSYPGLALLKDKISSDMFNIPLTIPALYLSGGQRQLLSLAMAMQKNPLVLILDEPTAALDEENAQQVMSMIDVISTRLLCICICHDKDLIESYVSSKRGSVTVF